MEDLRRYTVEKGEAFDVVLFDLPGTLRSEGVVYTVAAMDYRCNLQIFLCLFLEKLNMPQNTPVTKVS